MEGLVARLVDVRHAWLACLCFDFDGSKLVMLHKEIIKCNVIVTIVPSSVLYTDNNTRLVTEGTCVQSCSTG